MFNIISVDVCVGIEPNKDYWSAASVVPNFLNTFVLTTAVIGLVFIFIDFNYDNMRAHIEE